MRTSPSPKPRGTRGRHAGAPIGNKNALKHGKYAGGRHNPGREREAALVRRIADELKLVRRLERICRIMPRHHNIDKALAACWNSKRIRKKLLHDISEYDQIRIRRRVIRANNLNTINRLCAARNVLSCLFVHQETLESEEKFLDTVCLLFALAQRELIPRDGPTPTNQRLYNWYWRLFCAQLYEYFNPLPRSSRR